MDMNELVVLRLRAERAEEENRRLRQTLLEVRESAITVKGMVDDLVKSQAQRLQDVVSEVETRFVEPLVRENVTLRFQVRTDAMRLNEVLHFGGVRGFTPAVREAERILERLINV